MKKYKLINIIKLTVKIIIYTNRNNSTDLHRLRQVEMVIRDLFLIVKYWAETNLKLSSFLSIWHPVYAELLNFEL